MNFEINGVMITDVNDNTQLERAWKATRRMTQDRIKAWLKSQNGAPIGMESDDMEQEAYLVFYETLLTYSTYTVKDAVFTTLYYMALNQKYAKLYRLKQVPKALDVAESMDAERHDRSDGSSYTLHDILPAKNGREQIEADLVHDETVEAINALVRKCNHATQATWQKRLDKLQGKETEKTESKREKAALQHMQRDMARQVKNIGLSNGQLIQDLLPSIETDAAKHYYG